MRRLIWKELRERRLLLLALVASTSGLLVFGNYHVMLNDIDSAWILLSIFAALCLGAGTYSSELAGGTADFVRSRPISWKRMLAAKLTVGLGFVLVATVLMALVFRIVCPAQYMRFANPVDLAPSMALAFFIMGAAYLLGFVCSVVLPSMMGGVAIVVLVLFSCLLEGMWYQAFDYHPQAIWSFYLRFVGTAVAAVLISRFGLTLPTGWRMAHFCAIVLVFTIVGVPMDFTVPDPLSHRSQDIGWSLSPTGDYAVFTRQGTVDPAGKSQIRTYFLRVADGRKAELDGVNSLISESGVYWYKDIVAASDYGGLIRVGRMGSSGRLRQVSIRAHWDQGSMPPIRQSPAGRYLVLAQLGSKAAPAPATIVDLDKMRGLHLTLGPDVLEYWWQSDTEIGYMDRTGLHIVPVPE